MALDRPRLFQPVHQFYCAVVLNEQSGRDFAHGRFCALRQAMHSQQQLVLLGFETVLPCGGFAEVEKLTNLAPEFGETAVLIAGKIAVGAHK
jgi:hypothetical protein